MALDPDDTPLSDVEPPPEGGWPPALEYVIAAQAGDKNHLSHILAAGYPRLVGFLRGMGFDAHTAEELAAETCEGVVTGLRRLRAPQAFEAWFWAVARNRLRSEFRRRQRTQPVEGLIAPSTPEEETILSEEHHRIRVAMLALSPRDRQLLWLREVEMLSYEEIGGRFGTAAGAIRVACHRARKRLEEIYSQDEPTS
jgi:RNA polymerase sigma-70 factor (ECF subfamily)